MTPFNLPALCCCLVTWLLLSGAAVVAQDSRAPVDDAPPAVKPVDSGIGDRVPVPPAPEPVDPAELQAAIHRGVQFLLQSQNRDGSWGSADKITDIYAPVPGSYHAFRAAVTGMCVAALVETGGDSAEVRHSLERGEAWLLGNLERVRRADATALYNVWAHIYAIEGLTRLLKLAPEDPERQDRIRELIAHQIGMLERYASVDGGWGYYDFRAGTQRPASDSTSFTNAAGLVALHHAQAAGIDVPSRLVERAVAATQRQRKPDFSYLYGEYLKMQPMHPINRPAGSLGRSQACNLALRWWGDEKVTDQVLKDWLNRLISRNLWLDLARKTTIPHESHAMVAGYFFYFGHYYGGLCISELPLEERPFYQDHMARILMRLQEQDGSWWDFRLWNYHQQYGTAFALMTLNQCVKEHPDTPLP